MSSDRLLGGFEHLLLLAVVRLEENAYGTTIRSELLDRAGKDVAVGAIYTGLDRLEEKGFVESWIGEPTAKRGGRGKRFYSLTNAGRRALVEMDHAIRRMSSGVRITRETAHD